MRLRGLVRERADALDPHDRTRRGARRSTGSRSCSRSRSAPPPATASPNARPRLLDSVADLRRRDRARRPRSLPASRLNAVLAFWLAYILTRPLGASLGDYLSQRARTAGSGSAPPRPATSSWRDPRAGRLPDDHPPRRDAPGRLLPEELQPHLHLPAPHTPPPARARSRRSPPERRRPRAPRATRASSTSARMRKAPATGPFRPRAAMVVSSLQVGERPERRPEPCVAA